MASVWTFVFLLGTLFVFGCTACPPIVTRAQCNLRALSGNIPILPRPVPTVILHHTVTPFCTTQADCCARIRSMENHNMIVYGLPDIGYNFLVGEDGRAYEGRGWTRVGADAVGCNSRSICIAIIGDFTSRPPNAGAQNAARSLIQCGVTNGHIAPNHEVVCHPNVCVTPSPACPPIVTRAQCQLRAPSGNAALLPRPVPTVILHHTVTPFCSTQADCCARVRLMQDHHMNVNGWLDIGYNFLVGEDGRAYEGRGWTRVGAHAAGCNSRSIGIAIIGDFTSRVPNAAAQNAARNLIQCGVTNGHIAGTHRLAGHRNVGATACPGNALQPVIQTWPNFNPNPTC